MTHHICDICKAHKQGFQKTWIWHSHPDAPGARQQCKHAITSQKAQSHELLQLQRTARLTCMRRSSSVEMLLGWTSTDPKPDDMVNCVLTPSNRKLGWQDTHQPPLRLAKMSMMKSNRSHPSPSWRLATICTRILPILHKGTESQSQLFAHYYHMRGLSLRCGLPWFHGQMNTLYGCCHPLAHVISLVSGQKLVS